VIVELQQSAETSIARRIGPIGGNVVLGNCRDFSIKMFLPEIGVVTGVAKTLPSFSFPWAWTRTVQRFDLADANGAAKIRNNPIANKRVMRD